MSLFDFLRDAPPYVPLWPDGGSKRINFDKRFNLHTEEGNVGGKRAEHIWIDDVSVCRISSTPFPITGCEKCSLVPFSILNLLISANLLFSNLISFTSPVSL